MSVNEYNTTSDKNGNSSLRAFKNDEILDALLDVTNVHALNDKDISAEGL